MYLEVNPLRLSFHRELSVRKIVEVLMDKLHVEYIIRTTQNHIPPQPELSSSSNPQWYKGHYSISTADFIRACAGDMSLDEANHLLSDHCVLVHKGDPDQNHIYHLYDEPRKG